MGFTNSDTSVAYKNSRKRLGIAAVSPSAFLAPTTQGGYGIPERPLPPIRDTTQAPPGGFTAAGGTTAPQYPVQSNTLPQNYGFNDLATYEEKRRNDFANQIKDSLAKRREELSTALNNQGKSLFDMARPGIMEDLNSRGVYNSATANYSSQDKALKEIALANQQYLNQYDDASTAAVLQGQQDALDSSLDLRRGKLEGDLQEGQSSREEALARDLAKQNSKNQLTNTLIGTGGSLGGAFLAAKMFAPKAIPALASAPTATAGTASAVAPAAAATTAAPGVAPASAGIGLGGAAAIGAAGVGAALLSRAAEKKGGEAAGLVANPIGYQLNKAKELISDPKKVVNSASKSVSTALKGKKSDTGGIAGASQAIQSQLGELRALRAAKDSGQITPEQYEAQALPIITSAHQNVNAAVSRGSTWASAINPTWQQFQNEGFAVADPGRAWLFEGRTPFFTA